MMSRGKKVVKQLLCDRKNGYCKVCKERRRVLIKKRLMQYRKLSDAEKQTAKFVTLTLSPHVETDHDIIVSKTEKLLKAFREYRKNYLTGLKFFRVLELGKKKKRPHIHMLIFDIRDEIPLAPKINEWLKTGKTDYKEYKRKYFKKRGLGMYHCEKVININGVKNYMTDYISKSVNCEYLLPNKHLFDCSRDWPSEKKMIQNCGNKYSSTVVIDDDQRESFFKNEHVVDYSSIVKYSDVSKDRRYDLMLADFKYQFNNVKMTKENVRKMLFFIKTRRALKRMTNKLSPEELTEFNRHHRKLVKYAINGNDEVQDYIYYNFEFRPKMYSTISKALMVTAKLYSEKLRELRHEIKYDGSLQVLFYFAELYCVVTYDDLGRIRPGHRVSSSAHKITESMWKRYNRLFGFNKPLMKSWIKELIKEIVV